MSYVSLSDIGFISKWQLEVWMNRVSMVSNVSFSTEGGDLVVSFHIGSSRLSLLYSADTSMAYFRFTSKAAALDIIIREWHKLTEGLRLRIDLCKGKSPSLLELGWETVCVGDDIYFNLESW
jgi:hypothetical protein